MKYAFFFLLCIGCAATTSPGIPARPDELGTERLTFAIPKASRWELSNGLVVHYRYDEELPRMSGAFYFPGGSLSEPENLAGISSAAGSQLREGSIKGVTPEAFDRTLDSLAAVIETGFGAEYGSLTFASLSEDFPEVFGYAAKIVMEPQFNASRFELWRKLTLDSIHRRADNPETMGGMAFAELLYGKHSPFTRYATEESIRRLNVKEVQAFAQKILRPNGSFLAASGSIPEKDFRQLVEKLFGAWPRQSEPLPPLPLITQKPQPGIYVLERDFQQASILIGHLGPPRLTPDIYEMNIYNRVLGSTGFGSRLFDEIRTQLGLAYDVGGGIAPGVVQGTVQISLGSRNEGALDAIKRAIEICDDTLKTPPKESSFLDSKSAVEQSFAFRFDSPSEVAQRAAQQELFHYPKDFDDTYLARMAEVTPEMVREVGRRWVHPQDFAIVIVGNIPADKVAAFFKPQDIPVYRLEFDTEPKVLGKIN